jgi:prepilin-type N-terminal cleavage/methylation domain-containing protein
MTSPTSKSPMSRSRTTRSRADRGYSLLEVLVALTLASVLAVAAFTVFFNSQRATGRVTRLIENRQNSRTAIQLLERDLRMAGSGWGQINVDGSYNGSLISVPPITPFYGGSSTSSDTIGIIGAWDYATSLKQVMGTPATNVVVNNLSGFAVNDLFVVTNGQTAHMFQVTTLNTAGLVMYHANSSKYNMATTLNNWPSGGYKAGAKVYRVSWVSYQMDTLTNPRDQIVRWSQNSTKQVVAYNVAQFRVGYWTQDDTLMRNPPDISEIEQIHPVICMKTSGTTTVSGISDSSWATVKPRSF